MARKPSRTPGITKRGASWLVRVRRDGHSLSRTFDSYAEAERWRSETVGAIEGHTFIDRTNEQRTPLREVIQRYLEDVTPSKKGAKAEADRLRAWMREDFTGLPIISITVRHIVEWRNRRADEGKAPSTISNSMNLLSAVFKLAISEWGFRVSNPCAGIARPKPRPGRNVHLSIEDQDALLAACRQGPGWLEWITRLALETAMRQGELRALRWDHIHDSHIHIPDAKNGEARDVPLTTGALVVVRGMKEELPRRLDGWVFGDPEASRTDGGFTVDMVQNTYRRAVRLAVAEHGMSQPITFHDLRHVAATRLRLVHVDALDLSKTTGHKSLSMLARYDNPTPEDRAAAIRARERALLEVSKTDAK